MNIFSYFLIGAAIGCLFAGKKIGNKALLYGGVCALFPCLDEGLALFFSCPASLYVAGGVSHSLLYCILLAPILGWILRKFVSKDLTVVSWSVFAFLAMVSHCVFDILRVRGVGILEPFVHKRLALSIIPDVEFLSCIPLLFSFIAAMALKDLKQKRLISWFGMFLTSIFVTFAFLNKLSVQADFERRLDEQDVRYSRSEVFPVENTLFIWNCIAQDRDGFWMCYQSNLSKNDFDYNLALRNDYYLFELEDCMAVKRLTAYTRYFYVVEPTVNHTVLLHDLRYARQGLRSTDPYDKSYHIYVDENKTVLIDEK